MTDQEREDYIRYCGTKMEAAMAAGNREEAEEVWRPIAGFEFYEVSSKGRVRSIDRTIKMIDGRIRFQRGVLLKQTISQDGYGIVHIFHEAKSKTVRTHVLVASAFIGERPPGMDVAHNDGNPANNNAANLRYDTHSNNGLDMVIHGTSPAGERHGAAKLSAKQVLEIRGSSCSRNELAAKYGVSPRYISEIMHKKRWKNLPTTSNDDVLDWPAIVQRQAA